MGNCPSNADDRGGHGGDSNVTNCLDSAVPLGGGQRNMDAIRAITERRARGFTPKSTSAPRHGDKCSSVVLDGGLRTAPRTPRDGAYRPSRVYSGRNADGGGGGLSEAL